MTTRSSGRNFTGSIVEELGIDIVTGTYSEHKPFPVEDELCKRFGASRTALREAVKMLTAKGLLSARPRQGTRALPESSWNLLDPDILRWMLKRKYSSTLLVQFNEVRLAIEPQAAALAAKNAGPEEKQAVSEAFERMRAAERGEDDPLESDIAFHVAVLRAARNQFYTHLTELTATALRFSISTTNLYKGVRLANVADHKKVADAIIAGEPVAAADAMRKMVQEVLDLIHEHELPDTKPHAKRA
jgi:DNA-binding FadR family transcriptional regulator